MKIIHGNETERFEDGSVFIAHEYDFQDSAINTARIEIQGRYPATGSMRNTDVKELVYVESGKGIVNIAGREEKIKQGDAVLFDKGEAVFWDGNLVLITTCTPAWSKDQHEFLPE